MGDCCLEHPDHSEEMTRLNRASGQLEGVKKMVQDRKYCPNILTQLQAVRSAIRAVEANILERHISMCVKDAVQNKNEKESKEKIAELIKLFKKNSK